MMKRFLAVMSVLSLLVLGACNTVEGLGKDVEKAGEKIQKSVR